MSMLRSIGLIVLTLFFLRSNILSQQQKSFVPDWVKDAIFYQIFPERFANGNTKNDPKGTVTWESTPTPTNYFGGDLEGVIKQLDYLQELGINAIYFNPIFWSNSNHKYNTKDYMKIDPHFGDERIFKRLLKECHDRKIRVVLDFVPTHSGTDFFAFADIKKNGKKSKYLHWYNIKSFPVQVVDTPNYEASRGLKELPKLMVTNPDVKKYLFDATKKWTKMGIDGWMLDLPNEISHEWWKEWRTLVKSINPDCCITGEIWDNAITWMRGDEFDAVMNYRFRNAAIHFFTNDSTSPSQFDAALAKIRSDYPGDVPYVLQNLIDSHDTERYLTLCKGDKTKFMLTVFFQMTYVGAPIIYYGDEIGMTGERDPDCRKSFMWNTAQWDTDLLAYYKKLINIRKYHPALRRGSFTKLLTDDKQEVYVYSRTNEDENIICVINRSNQITGFSFPTSARAMRDEMFGNTFEAREGRIHITNMPPRSALLLIAVM